MAGLVGALTACGMSFSSAAAICANDFSLKSLGTVAVGDSVAVYAERWEDVNGTCELVQDVGGSYTWTSNAPLIAEVTGSGSIVFVYGRSSGQALITAKSNSGSFAGKSHEIQITVN